MLARVQVTRRRVLDESTRWNTCVGAKDVGEEGGWIELKRQEIGRHQAFKSFWRIENRATHVVRQARSGGHVQDC